MKGCDGKPVTSSGSRHAGQDWSHGQSEQQRDAKADLLERLRKSLIPDTEDGVDQ